MYNYNLLAPEGVEFVTVADATELPPGERLFVTIDEAQIIILNLAGNLYAIGDVCSHDGNMLDDAPVEGNEVVCPRHGARFDIRNGEAVSLPAVVDIPAYPVRVRDHVLEVGVPKKS
jgi:3-phenylpropionate/trans-cinnamate dioxygenase ferredoxin subunit